MNKFINKKFDSAICQLCDSIENLQLFFYNNAEDDCQGRIQNLKTLSNMLKKMATILENKTCDENYWNFYTTIGGNKILVGLCAFEERSAYMENLKHFSDLEIELCSNFC